MRLIWNYISSFLKEDFDRKTYLFFAVFMTVTVAVNYYLDFEDGILDKFQGTWKGHLGFFSLYAFAYYSIAIPKLKWQGKPIKRAFVLKSLFVVALIALHNSFPYYQQWIRPLELDRYQFYFLSKLIANLKGFILYGFVLYAFYLFVDREKSAFYGLGKVKGVDLRPYLWMLLIMVPLIYLASTQADFQKDYPRLKAWLVPEFYGLTKLQLQSIYEVFYLGDFVFIELVFRGFLVIGFVSILGKDAVLPMASLYCFIHFGKPMGEAISSIFGGYLLGVFAYYSRSILGGCIIHMGIAGLMEIAAIFQHAENGVKVF